MPVQKTLVAQAVPVKIWTTDIDPAAERQLLNIAQLPFIHSHVAAMPDVHLGIGATIGSVIACHAAIVPAAVGVDLGCGMLACRLSLRAEDLDEPLLRRLFEQISRDFPVGKAQYEDADALVDAARVFEPGLRRLSERHPKCLQRLGKYSKWVNQLGSLGGVFLREKNPTKDCQSSH